MEDAQTLIATSALEMVAQILQDFATARQRRRKRYSRDRRTCEWAGDIACLRAISGHMIIRRCRRGSREIGFRQGSSDCLAAARLRQVSGVSLLLRTSP